MTINKTSLVGKFYKWIYNDLPSDFCTLFWKSLIALIFLPLMLPLSFVPNKHEHWDNAPLFIKVLGGSLIWLIGLLILLLGFGVMSEYFGKEAFSEMIKTWSGFKLLGLAFLIGFVIIALVIGGIIGVVFIFIAIREAYFKAKYAITHRRVSKDEYGYDITEPSQVLVLWNTIRNKYCTKITWK